MMMQTHNSSEDAQLHAGIALGVPDMARILIVCENDSDTEVLKCVFQEAGLASESVGTITAGCESAKSNQSMVVLSSSLLGDGSWKSLLDVADHFNLSLEIILLTRNFTHGQWAEAIQDGAFDVLDVLYDLPKAAAAAKRAWGAAYLKRFRTPGAPM